MDESSSMNKARRENVNNAISTLVKELKKQRQKTISSWQSLDSPAKREMERTMMRLFVALGQH